MRKLDKIELGSRINFEFKIMSDAAIVMFEENPFKETPAIAQNHMYKM
jgi:hypothetical protein